MTNPVRRIAAMVVLLTASFMSLLDTTIVNVALGSIADGLGASSSALEWVISAYTLAFGMVLITAGRMGDRLGYRSIYLIGMAMFTGFSLACGLAQSPGQLIAFRALQGLGAGIFSPAISGSIQHLYSGLERAKAFGAMGTVIGVATALGPVVGGLIIQVFGSAHGWRWVFLVNVPIGIAALIGAALVLRSDASSQRHGLDPIGVLVLTVGLLMLLGPLIEGQSLGWPWYTFASMVAAVFVLLGFAWWERHQARLGHEPLVDPALTRIGSFTAGTLLAMAYFAAFTSVFFVLSLLWQQGLGRSAISTGLMIIPWSLGALLAATQVFRLVRRLGRLTLLIGCGLVAMSLIAIDVILHIMGTAVTHWALLIPLFVGGVGNSMFISPNQTFVLAEVPGRQAGSAGAVMQTGQRVGGAVGIAIVGTVFFSTLHVGAGGPGPAFVVAAEWALRVNVVFVLIALGLIFALRDLAGTHGASAAAP